MAISKEIKLNLVQKFGGSDSNTGKIEVQVAILTDEIKSLTTHMIANKKDKHSKRGLYMKVSKRKSLLTHLEKKDVMRYRELIKALGLRR